MLQFFVTLTGVVAICVGLFFVYPPAALMLAGVCVTAFGLFFDWGSDASH